MKHFLLITLWLLLAEKNDRLYAQEQRNGSAGKEESAPTRLFRIYEDNDFINIRGQGTDDAYTNGTRIDLFYTKNRPSRWWVDRNLPKAGDSSINVFGWGLEQLMFTPNDISKSSYQPDDYPYSGALLATHTLYSYNPLKKYDLQTEIVVGVMGPASLARQTQEAVHRLIHYQKPMGWDHQFRNDLLLNINFTAEKQLAQKQLSVAGPSVEVIGGGQVFYGTMLNGVAVYPLIRIGKMTPYFKGYLSQYSSGKHRGSRRKDKLQAYFVIKPEATLIFTNALLEGGLFTSNPNKTPPVKDVAKDPGAADPSAQADGETHSAAQPFEPYHDLHKLVYSINYGAVLVSGNFSISFIQNTSSSMMKGLYNHEVGNITLYVSW